MQQGNRKIKRIEVGNTFYRTKYKLDKSIKCNNHTYTIMIKATVHFHNLHQRDIR